MLPDSYPNRFQIQIIIVMDKNIPKSSHLPPRDFRVGFADIIRNTFCRFTHDGKFTNDSTLDQVILIKNIFIHSFCKTQNCIDSR